MFDGRRENRKHRVYAWILSTLFVLLLGGGTTINGIWENAIHQEEAQGGVDRYDSFMSDLRQRMDSFDSRVNPLINNLNKRSQPLNVRIREKMKGFRERWTKN